MRRFTIIGVEHDGSKHELAHVDHNPDAIVEAAKLKRQRMFNRHRCGERTYLNIYVRDNQPNSDAPHGVTDLFFNSVREKEN
jgi:hypothetical protein